MDMTTCLLTLKGAVPVVVWIIPRRHQDVGSCHLGWKWQVSMVEWSTKDVTAVFERSNKLTKKVAWLAGGAHKDKLRQLLA